MGKDRVLPELERMLRMDCVKWNDGTFSIFVNPFGIEGTGNTLRSALVSVSNKLRRVRADKVNKFFEG